MSDTDVTDYLLLIPPNYFIENTNRRNSPQKEYEDFPVRQPADLTYSARSSRNDYQRMCTSMTNNFIPKLNDYNYPPATTRLELNYLNGQLEKIQSEECNENNALFDFASDISTISNFTTDAAVKHSSNSCKNYSNKLGAIIHSTPVQLEKPKSDLYQIYRNYRNFEIDAPLERRKIPDIRKKNAKFQESWKISNKSFNIEELDSQHELGYSSLPSALKELMNNVSKLSAAWNKSERNATISKLIEKFLKEEVLRSQKLEKKCHLLQTLLLEYQQRLSVANEANRAKRLEVNNIQKECESLKHAVDMLSKSVAKSEVDKKMHNNQTALLKKELSEAIILAKEFQEKYTTSINEAEIKEWRHGAEFLPIIENSRVDCNHESCNNLKDRLRRSEFRIEELTKHCEELEIRNSKIELQRDALKAFAQKQKDRGETLRVQGCLLLNELKDLRENVDNQKKDFEEKQKILKLQYQQQLESVVTEKLKEFQEQLDKLEESLSLDYAERERLITEQTTNQLTMMHEKNEMELTLLQDKHKEEIELYQVQITNATKKIEKLQRKLESFESKRLQIAEKLHKVMKSQWEKAVEILES